VPSGAPYAEAVGTVREALWQRAMLPTDRFRRRRMTAFVAEFGAGPRQTVLDVGGTALNWELLEQRPEVLLLNLQPQEAPGYLTAVGDGTALPYPDRSFDVCFSNSVIEHLSTLENQRRFAAEVRRVADNIWVQTPARSFPFEPHYLTPFIHWLPATLRRRLVRRLTVYGWLKRPTREQVDALIDEYRPLSARELRELFPDCELRRERFLGLTKSYVVVRR
jgi:Methyltransferase domain